MLRIRSAVRRAANKVGYDIHRTLFPVRMTIPPLLQGHVDGAVLYAHRTRALESLPRGGVVAEIGVALGDFSQAMLTYLAPCRFDAFDLFIGLSHRAQYERRFADEIAAGKLHVHEGDSSLEMEKQPDSTYDVIYIDGDHSYEGVMRDANTSARKLKSDGILIFNDYIIFDYIHGVPYGVVPVVHEFCVNRGWKVVYFTLCEHLFNDIALRRG